MLLRFLADTGSNKLVRQEPSHVVPRLGVDAQTLTKLSCALAATVPAIPSGFHIRAKEYRVELERHPR